MSSGDCHPFPTAHQHAELERFFSDPKIIAYLKGHDWKLDSDHDVPYLAGYSVTPGTIYVDRHLAEAKPQIQGHAYDDWSKALLGFNPPGHELAEKTAMDVWGYQYAAAHEQVADACEHTILNQMGIKWEPYSRALRPYIKAAELERIENPPLDLDCRPYYQHPDHNDLKILRHLAECGVKDARQPDHPLTARAKQIHAASV